MTRLKNITGKEFGNLYVLNIDDSSDRKNIKWVCRCTCGNIKSFYGNRLRNGESTNCGCLSHRNVITKKPYESLYNSFLRNTKKRNLENYLSYKDFVLYTKQNHCHYCGEKITWSKYAIKKNGSQYNLDRKNNNEGYKKNNLVVCCIKCNKAKGNRYTYGEWKIMAEALKEYRRRPVKL
jgi:hypothetical protein